MLSLTGINRVAIANPQVADVKVLSPSQLLVTALGPGQTELTIWRGSNAQVKYAISVSAADPKQVVKEVRRLLGDWRELPSSTGADHARARGEVCPATRSAPYPYPC